MNPMPKITRTRTIHAIPHQYSCGGYWLAEQIDPDMAPEVWYGGKPVENTGQCYLLLSGRMEVLSRHQVALRIVCCEDRGETVSFSFIDRLPEGALIQF